MVRMLDFGGSRVLRERGELNLQRHGTGILALSYAVGIDSKRVISSCQGILRIRYGEFGRPILVSGFKSILKFDQRNTGSERARLLPLRCVLAAQ